MTETEIGLMLTKARTSARMTQAQLARAMGTTQPAIARAEGGHRMPTLNFIDRWARATGQSISIDFGSDRPPLTRAQKEGLVDAVLGRGRFNPWDRSPSKVEARILEDSGRGPDYFKRLNGSRGRTRRTAAG